MITAVSNCTG